MSEDRDEIVEALNVRDMIRAGHEVVQLTNGRFAHRGSCLRCVAQRAAKLAADRAASGLPQPSAPRRREATGGVEARIFEWEGHTFGQIGSQPPDHIDHACRTCRARSVMAVSDKPRRIVWEGHQYDDIGHTVIHLAICPACRPVREARTQEAKDAGESTGLPPSAERLTSHIGIVLVVAFVLFGAVVVADLAWSAVALGNPYSALKLLLLFIIPGLVIIRMLTH